MSVCNCGRHYARINGRTLKQNVESKAKRHPFGKIDRKAWIEICPSCHRQWLDIDEQHSLPFLDAGGLMRTAAEEQEAAPENVIDFAGFRFTRAALLSAMALQALEFGTAEMEARGARLPGVLSDAQAAEFSRQVCLWGGGARVWGKLMATNENGPGQRLAAWINAVKTGELDDEEAIARGIDIPGLGVSFASKHLRMLQPERFAVLDEVLCDGFGFALNRKGFGFFLRELRALQGELQARFGHACNVATLEAGLFMLVRQGVRARPEAEAA
jgi:hypothetical protein